MAKVSFICAHCGGEGQRESGDYNRKMRASKAMHCSKSCQFSAQTAKAAAEAKQRSKSCETCGDTFTPRRSQLRSGSGRFCSQACNTASREALNDPHAQHKGKQTLARLRAEGRINYRFGADNPAWKGGPAETYRRAYESGALAERVRRYRKNNPDKVREFTQRRAGRKLEKLPYGSIPKIRAAQGDKCAICCTRLKGKGHVDHIVPLARGGRHAPGNLQILCPPCNLHKSDRDPIVHMQSLGMLL